MKFPAQPEGVRVKRKNEKSKNMQTVCEYSDGQDPKAHRSFAQHCPQARAR